MKHEQKNRITAWIGAAMAGFLILTLFAWMALQALLDPGALGATGRFALNIARLPSRVSEAWEEARGNISGTERTRFLSVPRPKLNMDGFRPIKMPDGTPVSALMVRGDVVAADHGWRLIGGAMELDGKVGNVAILLRPDLLVERIWTLNEDDVEAVGKARDSRRVLHGLAILPDGSIVFGFDHGSALQRRDACNRLVWVAVGEYHHSVAVGSEGASLWALRDNGFADETDNPNTPPGTGAVRIDLATGAVEQEISMAAMIEANPSLGLFELARKDKNAVETNSTETLGKWLFDPVHFNDVEPLPASWAGAYTQFETGDLLLSARNINTVMVVDPDSLEIKWYQTGGMLRQHDPDWQADGTISVFDNAMGLGVSRIISIDPGPREVSVTLDGASTNFYTRIRGKHMRTERGDLAIVSPQQGRALELGPDGEPVLEFLNFKPGSEAQNFVLTEYLWLSETPLDKDSEPCTNN